MIYSRLSFTPVSLYNGILFWEIFIRIYVNFFLIIVTNHGVDDESAHHLLMIKEFYISIFFLSLLGVCALREVIYLISYIFSNPIIQIILDKQQLFYTLNRYH